MATGTHHQAVSALRAALGRSRSCLNQIRFDQAQWARRRAAHNESAREYALAKEAQRTPPRSPPRTPPRSPAAATQTTPARTPPRDNVAALRDSSPGRAALCLAIDRELRLQRRGLEEVAAGVRALVKESRHRKPETAGISTLVTASRKPPAADQTTIDTRRVAVARREADLVLALQKTSDPEKARRLTRDLHACRLHLRSLEFEAAARERLC